MSFTIVIAAAPGPNAAAPEELADHVAAGALRAQPTARVLRTDARRLSERLAVADLVLTAGASELTREAAARAAELGIPVVSLACRPGSESGERFPVGLATFEPPVHPEAIDVGSLRTGLRMAAAHVVEMVQAGLAVSVARCGPAVAAL